MNINIQKNTHNTINMYTQYIYYHHDIQKCLYFQMNYYHNTNGFRKKFMIIIKFLTNKMHNKIH